MMNLKTVNVRKLFVGVAVSVLLLLSMVSSVALLPGNAVSAHDSVSCSTTTEVISTSFEFVGTDGAGDAIVIRRETVRRTTVCARSVDGSVEITAWSSTTTRSSRTAIR